MALEDPGTTGPDGPALHQRGGTAAGQPPQHPSGLFFCLDALHGERRERSILFWKSLPVSDRTTVLSKSSIPLLVLPLVTFVVVVSTQLVMLLWTSLLLISHGMSPASTWTYLPLFQQSIVLLYGLAAIALWHAPVYGWALLVSGWARRATFLWAALPLIAIAGGCTALALVLTRNQQATARAASQQAASAAPHNMPHW